MRISDWSSDVCSSDLMAAALLLLVDGSQRRLRALINIAASLAGLVVAAILLWAVDHGGIGVYLAANWQAPFGIVLVADRLSVQIGRASCRERVCQYV